MGAEERRDSYFVLGHGATDGDGSFQLDALRPSSARFYHVYAVVRTPGSGSGFGCVTLKPDADEPATAVRLRPEQVIQGKLVDIRGQPAAGVEVQLNHVFHASRSAGVGDFDGIGGGFHQLWDVPPEELRPWPKPVTTDEQGRFTLAGIARGLTVCLEVRDIRFARQRFDVETDFGEGPNEVNLALQPATIIEGRALAADTGQPFAHAVIAVRASFRNRPGLFDSSAPTTRGGSR